MRVALIGDNCVEYVEQLLFLWNKGYCIVLIDWRLPVKKIIEIIQSTSVQRCYFIHSQFTQDKNVILIKKIGIECIIVEKRLSVEAIPKEIMMNYKENYSQNEAVILYSSGTTGNAKGVILSHFAISTNADSIKKYMNIKESDVIYIMKSLTHSSTLVGELLVGFKSRSKVIVKPVISNIRNVFFDIEKYRITTICLNPTLLNLLIRAYEVEQSKQLKTLKAIYCSGALLDNVSVEKARNYFKCKVLNMYGMTEAGPRITAQRGINDTKGSVGKPIHGVKIIIVDGNGMIQKAFEKGVIHVSTKSGYSGYANKKKGRRSLYKDWLNTGDIGYVNDKGELFIVGRQDNMLIHYSHNIYPESIESLIKSTGIVEECILAKNERDELACYYKSKSGGTLTSRQLQIIYHICKKELADFEIPSYYQRVEGFLYTKSGKIIRN